ncbi:ABC-type dipeptide/oligopeptide/nickel transport system [Elusimicrobium minutum Pei191]|uniref:ABC-type dipeptide/oligopeptide/nickel transport system n=1 Tax=Elusimicrobium minutum (strain Pei191) TaxID=445932 RepID=B2KE40_ELUMP|nr:ABC transporter permease [Elusimicrobium minutum]ACC98786.1 ABC-type dipeptide/oligopeptide/nickel transport system [Elusimicrobium minutum Pei191]
MNKLLKRILKNKSAMLGLALVLFFLLIAVFANQIAPAQGANPFQLPQNGYSVTPQPPNAQNIFGTTESQYDILYAIVWGSRMAFKVGITVVFFAMLIGILVGGIAAYAGGWADEIIMRFTDIIFAIPSLVLAMVIAAMLGPELKNMVIALTAVAWPSYARLIRGDILSVKERDYVLAARTIGAGGPRIFFKHIIPNSIYPSIIVGSLDIGYIVLTASSLSFLGLGSPPGTADWGQLIAMARNWILGTQGNPFAYAHTILIPGAALFLFVLGWNLLGDAFRDILDPRQH